MFYAALTMWLMVIVFTAHGIHRIWIGMVKPKIVNSILLPGTLVAQIGYVLGCFASGSPVSGVVLFGPGKDGEAQAPPPAPKIPLVGTMIVAMCPLATCALAIYLLTNSLGGPILERFSSGGVVQHLPRDTGEFWILLHSSIDLAADFLAVFAIEKLTEWRCLLLLYLTICLTVRMAPVPGNLRGSILTILGFGIIMAIVGAFSETINTSIQNLWPVLTYTAATLICLMIITLLIRGIVSLVTILTSKS